MLAEKWQRAILETWNNNIGFGKCDVVFNVQIIADPKAKDPQHASSPAGFPGANNFISVPEGSPADLGNPGIDWELGKPAHGHNTVGHSGLYTGS